jgi:sugar phosphate isomerase/epimerase
MFLFRPARTGPQYLPCAADGKPQDDPQTSMTTPTRRAFLGGLVAAAATAPRLVAAAAAPRWQIGCYTRPWAQHDHRIAFDAIAAAGYRYVGLMSSSTGTLLTADKSPEQAAALGEDARQRGLTVSSAWAGRFPVDKSLAEGVAGLRRLIDNAAACGCPNLLLGGTNERLHAAYYKVVAECCAYAAARNVGLSIKPHGGGNATGAQCRRIINEVGHDNFRLWYDPGNIFFYSDGKLDPVDDAATVDGLVVGMSVKDFRSPKEVNVTPGTGQVDFPRVLARLRQGGFTRGALVVECLTPGDLPHLQAEAQRARRSIEQWTRG